MTARSLLAVAAAWLLTAGPAPAQFVWTGAGADDNWYTAGNWQGGAVPTGTGGQNGTVAFSNAGGRTATNRAAAGTYVLNDLTFSGVNSSAYSINGLELSPGMEFRTSSGGRAPTLTNTSGRSAYVRTLTLTDTTTVTGAVSLSTTAGAGGLTLIGPDGNAAFSISDTAGHAGPTVLAGAALTAYQLPNTSGLSLTASSLTMSQSATSPRNLLADAAPLSFQSGGLQINGIGAGVAETVGGVSLGSGGNVLSVGYNTGGQSTLTSTGGLARTAGSTLTVDAAGLGGTGTLTTRVTFATAPTLVGGGGAVGTTTRSILPYAVNYDNPSGSSNVNFMTYDPAVGLRALSSAEQTLNVASGSSALVNWDQAGTANLTGTTTVNALRVTGTVSGSSATLAVSSGAVIMWHGFPKVSVGTLAFGSREGVIHVQLGNYGTISSAITGTAGLTVSEAGSGAGAPGYLDLRGANSYTGGTTLNHAVVNFDKPLGSGTITLVGGTLEYSGGTALTTADNVVVRASKSAVGNSLSSTSQRWTISGAVSGDGGLNVSYTSSNGGSVVLTNPNNSYTGTTTVSSGTVLENNGRIVGPTTVGSGGVAKGSGTYGTVAVNSGGTFAPGNSPGLAPTGSVTWAGGGTYQWEINAPSGTPGVNWDRWDITGNLAVTATAGSKFKIALTTLTAGNAAGPMPGFIASTPGSWDIAHVSGSLTGFDPAAFTLDTTGFQNATNGGTFALGYDGVTRNVFVSFNPVPEPATVLGLAAAGLAATRAGRRRPIG